MLRSSCVCTAALLALLGTALSSVAAEPLTSTPKRPELGPKTIPQDILRCERNYIYRHKALPCDSPVTADGEGLRPLLASVPKAREELEIYQANRRSLSLTAYTGMAGLLVAAFAPNFFESRGSKNMTIGLGISMTLGSLVFGKSRLMANEVHLDRAVTHYNTANPSDPIQLLQPGAPVAPEPTR